MGTFLSRFRKPNPPGGPDNLERPREYSWDKNRKLNVKDYSFNNIVNEVTGKLPGSVDGQQFTIQNCSNSTLYIFDHINTVTIDECKECKFILGPVKESIFIRDCMNCIFVVSSGQFRARDCRNLDIYLCCPTQPIIEASIKMRFNCLQLYYRSFLDHMRKAGLSPFNNMWNFVHDFTPCDQEHSESDHWSITTNEEAPLIPLDEDVDFDSVGLSFSWETSVVPHTLPPLGRNLKMWASESLEAKPSACMVAIIPEANNQYDEAVLFYRTLRKLGPDCKLSSAKELYMKSDHPFAKNAFGKSFNSGIVVGLRFFGPQCWEVCQKVNEYLSNEKAQRKQLTHLRKCCLKELCTQDDFFTTPAPYVPAFSG